MTTNWTCLELSPDDGSTASDLLFCHGAPRQFLGDPAPVQRARTIGRKVGFNPAPGAASVLEAAAGCPPVLLIGLSIGGPNRLAWTMAGRSIVDAMATFGVERIRIPDARTLGGADVIQALLEGLFSHSFCLAGVRTGHRGGGRFVVVSDVDYALAETVQRASVALNRARAWAEQPSNRLTPPAFAREAAEVLGSLGASVRILDPRALGEMGAGLLTAVGQGSEFGSHLFVAEWRGDHGRETWDAVLVGKGLTFDSGGLNLKSRPGIAKMKLDKAAGAAVLGAMEAAITRGSRANVVAVVPMAENAIDALSYRPGDVLVSLAGLTVEIADTDAEGRLALADAMTFGVREYRPTYLIDVTTLTGSIAAMLYEEFGGLFASNDRLAADLLLAGEHSGDRLWRLPLDDAQDYLVESDIADIVNLGPSGLFGNAGGSAVAGAKFLQRFVGDTQWAHIDMTGVAVATRATSRHGKGATGFGTRLLDRWLLLMEQEIRQG